MHTFGKLFSTFLLLAMASGASAAGRASHVVLVVWDGMRPDFVSEQNTPNLWRLAGAGVTFANHHPVYVCSTEVNGTALATGAYPGESGVIGNNEFRPGVNPAGTIMTAARAAVQRADQLTDNHYLARPTVPEILQHNHLGAVVAGAKTVTLLFNRRATNEGTPGIDVFEGNVLPESYAKNLKDALGAFPPIGLPKRDRDLWTTKALIGPLWQQGVPPFSVLWLSEPDYSQHRTGPGSPTSLTAIKSSDDNLGRLLAALDERGVRAQTDVFVVSDHAFSTIMGNADVAAALKRQGLDAKRAYSDEGPRPGEILVVGNGGAVFLYVTGHEQRLVEKAVHCLQAQPFSGVVFTRQPVEGAFTLDTIKLNSPDAPDIVLSLHWTRERSQTGAPGKEYSDYGDYAPGQGMHGSLSPIDMHNMCIAAGPDFRSGYTNTVPTGNVDIAPTVLAILGVKPQKTMSGRVLSEAFAQSDAPAPVVSHRRLKTSYRDDSLRWNQYLDISEVGGVVYFDEGGGEGTVQVGAGTH